MKSILSALALPIACLFANPVNAESPADTKVDHFADNAFGNAVAIVQHPAGIHHDGVTYITYQGPLEDPYIASYHHETGKWVGPIKAGVSAMGKDPSRKIDNHGKPALVIDDEGYLHIAFGGHGGMPHHGKNPLGDKHYGEMRYVVSKKPYDITAWERRENVSLFGTYNQFVKMPNGDIYLFYRHGAHRSDWVYQKSTDNGKTYAPAVSFLKHKRRDDLPAVDSWYAWAGNGEGDDIIIVFDYHVCWDGKGTPHGHIAERHDVFYTIFDTATDTWKNVQGEPITLPIEREQAYAKALVKETGDHWTFQGSTRLDDAGHPHILLSVGTYTSGKFSDPKRSMHIRWTGEQWTTGGMRQLPVSSGDLDPQTPEKVRLLLETFDDERTASLAWWNSEDGGKTFTQAEPLFSHPKSRFALTALIENAHPDARVAAIAKERGTDMYKIFLIGDNGPIQRLASEANTQAK